VNFKIRQPPKLRYDKLSKRITSFFDKQPSLDNVWRGQLAQNGWANLAISPGRLLEEDKFGANPSLELPPFLRVGRLAIEKRVDNIDPGDHYMLEQDYPAFVSLRDVPAIAFGPQKELQEVASIAQISLVHLLSLMDPAVVKVTAIDLTGWGTACSLLRAACPNLQTITSKEEKSTLFGDLREEVKKNDKLLGLKHQTLYSHNKSCPDAPQPYHFVYISSFNNDLENDEPNLIATLAKSGAGMRAGIYFFLVFDDLTSQREFLSTAKQIPSIVVEQPDHETSRIKINDASGISTITDVHHGIFEVIPDRIDSETVEILVGICHTHLSTKRFTPVVFPLDDQGCWQSISADGLRLAIGKSGKSVISLVLGKPEVVHNALVGGAVGTGKTILLHAIICQALREYSPEELRLSLLDYKEGTEFAVYSKAPHLFALSLGQNAKFGIDLLRGLLAELSQRASLFKACGVSSLSDYRALTNKKLCRHLIIIDEFQVLLNHPKLGTEAQQLLEDLIRRGRSFGFNVILSSQSLSDGALSPAIRSNLGCRICLRLSERECMDFLGPDNVAAARFDQPGQAVYNNREGHKEGNIEFRVAYYEQHEILEFIDRLVCVANNHKIARSESYIYNSELPLQVSLCELSAIPDSLLFAIEEGIPVKKYAIILSKGQQKKPLYIAGVGCTRDALRQLIVSQLCSRGCRFTEVGPGAILSQFCQDLISEDKFDTEIETVILQISRADSENFDIKVVCDMLIESNVQLICFFEFGESIASLGFDYNDAAYIVCTDRRSTDRLSYGGASEVNESLYTAILMRPFEDPLTVRIPLIES
jgi:hypothetical protein